MLRRKTDTREVNPTLTKLQVTTDCCVKSRDFKKAKPVSGDECLNQAFLVEDGDGMVMAVFQTFDRKLSMALKRV